MFLLAAIAVWGTLRGTGPFGPGPSNESLLLLQVFMGVSAVTSLALAAEVAERRQIERQLREHAVQDALTGLANYREFRQLLEAEVQRPRRTDRYFALLFVDLDEVEADQRRARPPGGSRALCRVADVIRASSRTIDSAARFGGDEFALILPETSEPEAHQVANRIRERLAADPEPPPVTVSIGLAVFPRNGDSAEALLDGADRALYRVRAQGDRG